MDEAKKAMKKKEQAEENTSTPVKETASKTSIKKENETPTPRKRKPAASNSAMTPTKKSKKDTSAGDTEFPPTGTANGGAGGTPTRATLPSIPTSLAAAGTDDRMILRLRDDENKPWSEITKSFLSTTGIKVGSSTLRMRYHAMKANFVGISEEDESRLIRFKNAIEEKFESEKWHRIGEAINHDGGAKYPAAALQKKFKEMSKKGTASASFSGMGLNSGGEREDDDEEE